MVDFQNKLDTASNTINQQTQKIDEKNQQITDLMNQLGEKEALVNRLQREIENSKSFSQASENSNENKEMEESSSKERNENDISQSSDGELLEVIKQQKHEIQNLKGLMTGEAEMVQEVPAREAVQQLPQKNAAALWLCLLGYSLVTVSLCFNLLKNKKRSKN